MSSTGGVHYRAHAGIPVHQRTYINQAGKTKTDQRSELEDWFMALVDARNDVIHNGTLKTGLYAAPPERPLSRYAGSLFWTGERVLREAIKATLGSEFLLWGPFAREALIAAVVEAGKASSGEPRPAPSEPDPLTARLLAKIRSEPRPPDRDLPTLLAALGCDAANRVVISKAHGYGSASPEVALESSLRAIDWWVAEVCGTSMLISQAERNVLRTAGAEDEISDY